MRIIIIGGGALGYPLSAALSSQHDVFIVDPDPVRAARFADLDVEFISGGGTNPDVLRRAGVESCELLIAATRLDEVNIVACSLGDQLGAHRTICFVTKEGVLHMPGGSGHLKEHFGIDQVIWPEAELADSIERIIKEPGAIKAELFEKERIQLLEFRLGQGSSFVGRSVSSLTLPHRVVIVALKRGDSTSVPRGDSELSVGDKIILMGTREGMLQLKREMSLAAGDKTSQVVTIIGAGDVGFRLAQKLDQAKGIRLRIIERDRSRGEKLAATLKRGLVLNGDGTDLELLESEDIGRSDVLVSVVDNDERNLFASILGRQLGVSRIITRVSKPSNIRLFERVGVDVPLSAGGAAVASLVHQVDGGRSRLLTVLEEGQARVLDISVPQGFQNSTVRELRLPQEAIIGTVVRDDEVIVPSGDDSVKGGDHLLVCCTEAAVANVRDLFTQET